MDTKKIAAAGRFGDTMLARLTESQEKLLKEMGGSGTINPETGLKEYFDFGSFAGAIAAPIAGSLVSGILNKGTSDAQKASANAATANTELQTRLAERSWQLGDETKTALAGAYEQLMKTPGFSNLGRFDMGTMGGYVQDREGMVEGYRDKLSGAMLGNLAGASASIDPTIASYMSRVNPAFANAASSLGGHTKLLESAPGQTEFVDGRYAADVNNLSTDLLLRMQRETDRSLQDAFGDVKADSIGRGLSSSTYDIEARKGFADVAARRRNLDTITALEDALKIIGGQQQLDMNAANMDRGQVELLAQLFSQNNTMSRGLLSDAINVAEAEQALTGNEWDRYFRNRALARGDYTDAEKGYVDDYATLWADAFQRWANMQGLRGNTIAEITDLITSPNAAAGGAIGTAGQLSGQAAQTAATQAAYLSRQLGDAAQGFGNIFQRAWFEGAG